MSDDMPNHASAVELVEVTVEHVQAGFASGAFTSESLTEAFLDRIATYNARYNAIVFMNPDAWRSSERSTTARTNTIARLFMTAPGVGAITALSGQSMYVRYAPVLSPRQRCRQAVSKQRCLADNRKRLRRANARSQFNLALLDNCGQRSRRLFHTPQERIDGS